MSAITDIDNVSDISDKWTVAVSPSNAAKSALRILKQLGSKVAIARRSQNIPAGLFAEALDVSRDTLWRLERGDPTVAAGTLVNALALLGLHQSLTPRFPPPTVTKSPKQKSRPVSLRPRRNRTPKSVDQKDLSETRSVPGSAAPDLSEQEMLVGWTD